ncbi:MAG: hypothetical protein AAF514_02625 [Verrucomicrobiota bacterium]
MDQEPPPIEGSMESGLLFKVVFGAVFVAVILGMTFGVMKAAFYVGGGL